MDDYDELARLSAEMEQARAGFREVGSNLWAFYQGLTEQGFDSRQALTLTSTFLAESLRGSGGDGSE